MALSLATGVTFRKRLYLGNVTAAFEVRQRIFFL
jgi:hypothetical protein